MGRKVVEIKGENLIPLIKETIKDDGEQPCEVADFACELK